MTKVRCKRIDGGYRSYFAVGIHVVYIPDWFVTVEDGEVTRMVKLADAHEDEREVAKWIATQAAKLCDDAWRELGKDDVSIVFNIDEEAREDITNE